MDDVTLVHPEQTAELPLTPAPAKAKGQGQGQGQGQQSIFLFSGPRCGGDSLVLLVGRLTG